jgi:hypothetical protein
MARATFINAILSGKLGGSVYANNKGGAYVRQYVKPTNPATQAQADARNIFRNSGSGWGSLTSINIGGWNAFALTNFAPRKIKSGVLYSGFNAYLALCNQVRQSNRIKRTMTAVTPTPNVFTVTDFVVPAVAPTQTFNSDIQESPGHPLKQSIGTCYIKTNGEVGVGINFDQTLSAAPEFKNPLNGLGVGYTVFCSAPFRPGQFIQNPEIMFVGSTGKITSCTGTFSGTKFEFKFAGNDLPIVGRKTWIAVGDYVQITVYSQSLYGQMAKIGSVTAVVAS